MNFTDPNHTQPCASCPYRLDAKVGLWHPSEFQKLLREDADTYGGAIFACHGDGKREPKERRPCIGWLLDQTRRGCPSIQLRLKLMRDPAAARFVNQLRKPRGLKLYRSIAAMCRANGVDPTGEGR